MARKLRLEYEGAMYHVINRGNYRADIFATEGAKAAFEICLFEACAKAHWQLHAYVIMRNHYHLALETPAGNLVEGMRWLQSTYANRFNRLRGERGHVFQGRYHALLTEGLPGLGAVGHYIHLNPARARLLTVERLQEYRYSSYHWLRTPRKRPAGLTFEAVLSAAGQLTDTRAGWASYHDYLTWLHGDDRAQKTLAFDRMCQGWALGSGAFKRELVRDHLDRVARKELEAESGVELRPLHWQEVLEAGLRQTGKTLAQAATEPKGAPWKVALAAHLKSTTTASNHWLAQTLRMGAPAALSRYVAECRQGLRPEAGKLLARISKSKV